MGTSLTPQLRFIRDRCGHAYKFRKNIINVYDCYWYDWKTGWVNCYEVGLAMYGAPETYDGAVALCTAHAKKHGWFKYLPHTREKTAMEVLSGVIAGAALSL